jgi:hypothetical protein
MPPDVKAAYHAAVLALLSLPMASDGDGKPAPHTLRLDPTAQDHLRSFVKRLEPHLGDGGRYATMPDWAGKLAGAIVRIAGLLHLAANPQVQGWEVPIDGHTLDQAIRIGEYLLTHAIITFGEMGADAEVQAARFVLAWIEKTGVETFTKRDAHYHTRGRLKKVEEVEAALRRLERHGYVREQEPPERGGPGRKPSPVYLVNPLALGGVPPTGDTDGLAADTNGNDQA